MKLVVVGGVAGGASCAARVRRIDESAEITIYERGENVSFSNCSLPYYIGGVVEQESALIMMTPQAFKTKHNIDVKTRHEVTGINRDKKTVTVKDLVNGTVFEDPYDKLVLAPGARPVVPRSIAGADGEKVFTVRNVADIHRIKVCVSEENTQKAVVIGGGFIGIEMAENLKLAGKSVTIVEGMPQILAPFDYDMVQMLHKELTDKGIQLLVNSRVKAITDNSVILEKDGKEEQIPQDAVILAIGTQPETELAASAGLDADPRAGIRVNDVFQTSDPDIYAVGDAVQTFNRQTGNPGKLSLAGPAQRQARIAANHMMGLKGSYKGFIGSSCIKVFGLNAAATGLNEKALKALGIPYDFSYVIANDKVGIMPDSNYMAVKLLFSLPDGRILGAQAIGKGEADKRVDAIAALIGMNATIEDLNEYEHCYQPMFSTAKDAIHMAGLVAENLLNGMLRQVHVDQVRELAESGAYIVDVREPGEYQAGHIKGAHNIPLTNIREHLDEIPKDVPVYLHCRSSQRSYYAYRYLTGNGFDNLTNISGSFLGISLYEYFNDQSQGREPIVTAYNFN